MINDNVIEEFDLDVSDKGHFRAPLVWIIDQNCLYDTGVNFKYVDMFKNYDEVIDVSYEYANNKGITVRFLKNGIKVEDFNTSEYFGSILLSNPLVIDLREYPYGYLIQSPNAKFDGEKFILLNIDGSEQDMSLYSEWHISQKQNPDYKL